MIKILLYSLTSVVVLFILTKLMGEKQISQMNLFDYITGITIGSIAAEMATNLDRNVMRGITAMSVYALLSIAISYVSQKSPRMRRMLSGSPIILMRNGQIMRDAFKESHMDLNEFLMCSRLAGFYNVNEIDMAIMEINGAVSFLPVEKERPLSPGDVNMDPPQKLIAVPVVMDGNMNSSALRAVGQTAEWLRSQLKTRGYKSPKEVFLAVCDKNAKLTVYAK